MRPLYRNLIAMVAVSFSAIALILSYPGQLFANPPTEGVDTAGGIAFMEELAILSLETLSDLPSTSTIHFQIFDDQQTAIDLSQYSFEFVGHDGDEDDEGVFSWDPVTKTGTIETDMEETVFPAGPIDVWFVSDVGFDKLSQDDTFTIDAWMEDDGENLVGAHATSTGTFEFIPDGLIEGGVDVFTSSTVELYAFMGTDFASTTEIVWSFEDIQESPLDLSDLSFDEVFFYDVIGDEVTVSGTETYSYDSQEDTLTFSYSEDVAGPVEVAVSLSFDTPPYTGLSVDDDFLIYVAQYETGTTTPTGDEFEDEDTYPLYPEPETGPIDPLDYTAVAGNAFSAGVATGTIASVDEIYHHKIVHNGGGLTAQFMGVGIDGEQAFLVPDDGNGSPDYETILSQGDYCTHVDNLDAGTYFLGFLAEELVGYTLNTFTGNGDHCTFTTLSPVIEVLNSSGIQFSVDDILIPPGGYMTWSLINDEWIWSEPSPKRERVELIDLVSESSGATTTVAADFDLPNDTHKIYNAWGTDSVSFVSTTYATPDGFMASSSDQFALYVGVFDEHGNQRINAQAASTTFPLGSTDLDEHLGTRSISGNEFTPVTFTVEFDTAKDLASGDSLLFQVTNATGTALDLSTASLKSATHSGTGGSESLTWDATSSTLTYDYTSSVPEGYVTLELELDADFSGLDVDEQYTLTGWIEDSGGTQVGEQRSFVGYFEPKYLYPLFEELDDNSNNAVSAAEFDDYFGSGASSGSRFVELDDNSNSSLTTSEYYQLNAFDSAGIHRLTSSTLLFSFEPDDPLEPYATFRFTIRDSGSTPLEYASSSVRSISQAGTTPIQYLARLSESGHGIWITMFDALGTSTVSVAVDIGVFDHTLSDDEAFEIELTPYSWDHTYAGTGLLDTGTYPYPTPVDPDTVDYDMLEDMAGFYTTTTVPTESMFATSTAILPEYTAPVPTSTVPAGAEDIATPTAMTATGTMMTATAVSTSTYDSNTPETAPTIANRPCFYPGGCTDASDGTDPALQTYMDDNSLSSVYGFLCWDLGETLPSNVTTTLASNGATMLGAHTACQKAHFTDDFVSSTLPSYVEWIGMVDKSFKYDGAVSSTIGKIAAEGIGSVPDELPLIINFMKSDSSGDFQDDLDAMAGVTTTAYHDDLFQAKAVVDPAMIDDIAALDYVLYLEFPGKLETHFSSAIANMGLDYVRQYIEAPFSDDRYSGVSIPVGFVDTGLQSHREFSGKDRCGINYSPLGGSVWGPTDLHGTASAGVLLARGVNHEARGTAPTVGDTANSTFRVARLDLAGGDTGDALRYMSGSRCGTQSPEPQVVSVTIQDVAANGTDSTSRAADHLARFSGTAVFASAGDVPFQRVRTSPGAAKNVITIGHGEFRDGEYLSESRRGPVGLYGRLKPDLLAPGRFLTVRPSDDLENQYTSFNVGSSASAPAVAGLSAGLMEHYSYLEDNPALLRALLLSSSAEITPQSDAAGYKGFGYVDSYGAHWNRPNADGWKTVLADFDQTFGAVGATTQVTIPSGAQRVRFVMTWIESPSSAGDVQPVQHNLDLVVVGPDGERSSRASFDNLEFIEFDNPQAGTYTIYVEAHDDHDIDLESLPVGLSVTWRSGDPGSISLESGEEGELVDPITLSQGEPYSGVTSTLTVINTSTMAHNVYSKLDMGGSGSSYIEGLSVLYGIALNTTRKDNIVDQRFRGETLTAPGFTPSQSDIDIVLGDIVESGKKASTMELDDSRVVERFLYEEDPESYIYVNDFPGRFRYTLSAQPSARIFGGGPLGADIQGFIQVTPRPVHQFLGVPLLASSGDAFVISWTSLPLEGERNFEHIVYELEQTQDGFGAPDSSWIPIGEFSTNAASLTRVNAGPSSVSYQFRVRRCAQMHPGTTAVFNICSDWTEAPNSVSLLGL